MNAKPLLKQSRISLNIGSQSESHNPVTGLMLISMAAMVMTNIMERK